MTTTSNPDPRPTAADVIVKATPLIGLDVIVFSAWERTNGHGTQCRIDGEEGYWGRIGTRIDPAAYTHLSPGSIERAEAVAEAYAAEKQRAVDIILDHVPDLHSVGRIKWTSGEVYADKADVER